MHIPTLRALLVVLLVSLATPTLAQVDIDLGGGVNGSATGSAVDTSVGIDTTSDTSAITTTSISLTQDEVVSASLDAESAGLGSASVTTGEDLSIFATAMMKRDTDIEEVDVSGDDVSLEYRLPARFLGIIPGSIRVTVEVEADGTVDVDYPWYRFLFAVQGSDTLKADLRAGVEEVLARTGGTLTARVSAELLEVMHAALSSSTTAETSRATTADMAGPQDSTLETEFSGEAELEAE